MPKLDLLDDNDGPRLVEKLDSERGISVIDEDECFKVLDERMPRLVRVANFINELHAADVNNDRLFMELVNEGMDLAGLIDTDLSAEFSCSLPTIGRWANGMATPHPFMRRPIYKWLEAKVLNG